MSTDGLCVDRAGGDLAEVVVVVGGGGGGVIATNFRT